MESKKINQLATNVAPQSTDLTIIGDPITGVSKKITWLQVSTLIGTAANLQQVTDNGATTTNPIAIGGLTITGLATGVLKSDSGVISSVPFGAANGVATLGGDGKVPSIQLPSYVDDVVEVANYAALPVTGETGKIYITLDNNKVYRWTGSTYVEVAADAAVWGAITGTLSNQTDLQSALNAKVPYTGATGAVNLGAYDLTVNNLTIGKGTSALSNNSALGYRALFHITTGNYNTAVGYEAAHNTTTGQYNTALGQSSLFTNTTGSQNTALGLNALLNNTTGGSNVVVGLDAMQHNTTGSSNTALGYNAGSHITGGATPNTTASNGIFIGRDSKAKVDGGANEIVIGYNAIGNGSNTATFGNTSTTANYFTGSINGGSFVKSGGTSSQFLMADGSVNTSVLPSGAYLPLIGGTLTGGLIGTTANFTQTLATITAAASLDAATTYTLSTNITSVNSYNFISRYKLNLASGTYNSSLGQENATAIFAFTVINGNNGSTSTQPIRGVTAGFAVDAAAIKLADYRGFQVSSFDSSIAGNTITNAYGLYIAQLKGSSNFTITNGYGIYQVGTNDNNYFAGKVLIGTNTPSTFILDVSGTARVTGQVTLGSTITNGTYTYTLPSATGTLALTSQLTSGTVTSVAALTLGTTGTDLSSSVATGTTTPVITLNVPTASATNRGALSSADWTTFNNKASTASLANYLLLTGGTLTGALIGTTASFSGAITMAANSKMEGSGATNFILASTSAVGSGVGPYQTFKTNGSDFGYIGAEDALMSVTGNRLALLALNGLSIRTGASYTERLSIDSSTGAATFSNLAGTGSRAVLADANGLLSAPVSDISVKENIKPIGYGLSEILKINPVWFDFIDEYKNYGEGRQNGNIAQEMQEIIPEAVFVTPSTGKMGINYDQLHAVYIKAIQELKLEIEELKALIAAK
ncbi:MAG TPA: hypothetical protein DEB23_05420 [Chitinophagaceae bacterium]|nr:hypothetical protein [Chitinophagaceae bacterium]